MIKIDLHLIGNSIVDQVFEIKKSKSDSKGFLPGSSNSYSSSRVCFGGLGNLLSVFKKSKLNFHVSTHIGKDQNGQKLKDYFLKNKINFSPYGIKETSSALLLSETLENNIKEKTSFVRWGDVSDLKNFKPVKARWAHISYLDVVHNLDLSELRKQYDYMSADLCLNDPKKSVINKVLKSLKYLDFLFISTNEAYTYTNLVTRESGVLYIGDFLTKLLRDKKSDTKVILHSPYFCSVCERSEEPVHISYPNARGNVSVVGAGDKFCANFISFLLYNCKEITKRNILLACERSHKKTKSSLETYEEI